MAGPWEKYQTAQPAAGPWQKYSPAQSEVVPADATDVPQPREVTPVEETSLIDTIMGVGEAVAPYVAQGAIGARQGVSNILGLPVDLVNMLPMAANMLPGEQNIGPITDTPIGGSETIDAVLASPTRALQYLFGEEMADPEPQSAGQRITRRVGEELGATAVPVAGAIGKAARVGVEGARELNPVVRSMVEPAAVNQRKFLAQETAAAGSAGAGAGTAVEVARNAGYEDGSAGQNVADLIGQILGAGAPITLGSVGNTLATTGSAAVGGTRLADDVAKDVAVETLTQNMSTPRTAAGVPDTQQIADLVARNAEPNQSVIPGLKYSLSDVTRDPGLQALEYGRSQSTAPNAGRYVQRRAENAEAVDQAMQDVAPNGNPGALRSELIGRRDAALQDAARETTAAQQGFDIATRDLQPLMTADARGTELRAALQDASDNAKAIVSELWQPLNEADVPVPAGPAASAFRGVDENLSLAETKRFRPVEADIPAQLAEEADGGMTTMSELAGLRSALTSVEREAVNAGDPAKARIASQYVQQLDTVMDANIPPQLREQYEAARAGTRDYKDRFTRTQTDIGRTLAKRDGQYVTSSDDVARRFVQSDEGNIASFQALMRETGKDVRTRDAVRDQMLADISKRNLLEKPDQLDAYLGRYSTVLNEFPDLRKELTEAGSARRALAEYQAKEADLQNLIGTDGKGAVAEYLKFGGDQAERALRAATSSKDPGKAMDDILTFVNDDPTAVAGARQVMWDRIAKEATYKGKDAQLLSGGNPWSGPALTKFMADPANSAVLKRLYKDNPEHLQKIATIAEVMRTVDTRGGGKASASSGTAQGLMANAPSYESVMSRVYNVQRGVVGPVFAASNLIGIWARRAVASQQKKAVDQILDRALLEPEFAAVLLRENNPANRAALRRMGEGWQGNQIATLVDMLEEADQTDEDAGLKRSIMNE